MWGRVYLRPADVEVGNLVEFGEGRLQRVRVDVLIHVLDVGTDRGGLGGLVLGTRLALRVLSSLPAILLAVRGRLGGSRSGGGSSRGSGGRGSRLALSRGSLRSSSRCSSLSRNRRNSRDSRCDGLVGRGSLHSPAHRLARGGRRRSGSGLRGLRSRSGSGLLRLLRLSGLLGDLSGSLLGGGDFSGTDGSDGSFLGLDNLSSLRNGGSVFLGRGRGNGALGLLLLDLLELVVNLSNLLLIGNSLMGGNLDSRLLSTRGRLLVASGGSSGILGNLLLGKFFFLLFDVPEDVVQDEVAIGLSSKDEGLGELAVRLVLVRDLADDLDDNVGIGSLGVDVGDADLAVLEIQLLYAVVDGLSIISTPDKSPSMELGCIPSVQR